VRPEVQGLQKKKYDKVANSDLRRRAAQSAGTITLHSRATFDAAHRACRHSRPA
jgi:hypothetical protein